MEVSLKKWGSGTQAKSLWESLFAELFMGAYTFRIGRRRR